MKKSIIYFVVIVIIAVVAGLLYLNSWYNDGISKPVDTSSEKVRFEIAQGESTGSIGKRLEELGLIKDDTLFKFYLRREGRGGEIQAGEFNIARNLTIPEIVDLFSNAVELDTVRVTLIEGWRYTQMADELELAFAGIDGAVFTKAEFLEIARSPDTVSFSTDIQTFLTTYKPSGKSLEGFLYPDTYEFQNDASTRDVVERLVAQFVAKTKNITRDDNFYNDLILASIVERESLTNEERPDIASVFTNRLDIDMALESDATVNYATGKSDPRPTYEDLRTDSPYNTYKYPGLPPTPICNPRVESISAAVNPADTKYYYFIHEQDGSGQVHFANTLSEHNANVSKYLD